MIESLDIEKLVISRQTLSAFPQTTLQNALDKLFKHVDKLCLHSQIVQTSPVDKLCRQTLSAKNPPKTVDKLCLHFRCRQPLQRYVDEQECRRPQIYLDKVCLHNLSTIPAKVQRVRLHF